MIESSAMVNFLENPGMRKGEDEDFIPTDDNSLFWIDLETTGLSSLADVPLEVGIVLTDIWGNVYDVFHHYVWSPDEPFFTQAVLRMTQWVRETHEQLLVDIKKWAGNDSIGWEYVDAVMASWMKKYRSPLLNNVPLTGSSVHFDQKFVEEYFPTFAQSIHYRIIDVSTLTQLAQRHNPALLVSNHCPEDRKLHRVLPDLADSINKYKFYVEHFLRTTE